MSKGGIIFAVILLISIPVILATAVIGGVNDGWRNDAVAHGAAVYYLDENHERQWKWKDE